jgi:hypothetical protein
MFPRFDSSSLKDYIPLASVVLGGLLTVIGGFFSNAFSQRLARGTDRRRFLRDKLEEAYQLSQAIEEWAIQEMRNTVTILIPREGPEPEQKECPIDRLSMIVRLYIPDLREEGDKLSDAVDTYRKALFTYYQEAAQPKEGQPFDEERYRELFGTSHDTLKQACAAFRTEVERDVRRWF